jgi:hypothetical protein
MARVEPAAAGASAWLVNRSTRYFFVLLALFGILIASIVFVPQFLKFAAGTFPIAWVLNVHGALMGAWLALFFAQALLASTGRLALHRKLGTFGIVLGFPVWASMVLVEMRRKVVSPLDPDLSPAYDLDLPGIYVYTMFLVFFLVPLVAYDYFSAKRLHPATIAASCMLLGAQGVVLLVWENSGWRHLAYSFTVALRSMF